MTRQIPPHRPQDHIGAELPTLETLILPYTGRLSLSRHAMVVTDPACGSEMQQNLAAHPIHRLDELLPWNWQRRSSLNPAQAA